MPLNWPRGREVMHRSAKPSTPVRIRPGPQIIDKLTFLQLSDKHFGDCEAILPKPADKK